MVPKRRFWSLEQTPAQRLDSTQFLRYLGHRLRPRVDV